MTEKRSTYYREGFRAGRAGEPKSYPYDPNTHAGAEWLQGYESGFPNSSKDDRKRNKHAKPKFVSPDEKERPCITCGKKFLSAHIGNRMCKKCRGTAANNRSAFDQEVAGRIVGQGARRGSHI